MKHIVLAAFAALNLAAANVAVAAAPEMPGSEGSPAGRRTDDRVEAQRSYPGGSIPPGSYVRIVPSPTSVCGTAKVSHQGPYDNTGCGPQSLVGGGG